MTIKNTKFSIVRTTALTTTLFFSLIETGSADYMQSLGQSQRSMALGGAFTARADDTSVFYSNPAGATKFGRTVIGVTSNFLNTTNADLIDSGGNNRVEDTVENHEWAIAPTLAAYYPVNDKLTVGLGFGAANGITANWTNEAGIHRYSMSEQTVFTVDLVPTFAYQLTDNVSVGLSLNVVAFTHLKTETLIPDTFGNALLAGVVGAPTPTSPIIGSFTFDTNDDTNLLVPPGDFDSAFDEVGFTVGVLWDVNDRLSIGANYRSEQSITFKGEANLAFPVLGFDETVDYSLDMDSPAFFQAGIAYDVIPERLTVSVDLQWTGWSDATLFGSPLEVRFAEPITVPTGAGPASLTGVDIDYDAEDTIAIRVGVSYRINERWEILAGLAHDPSFLDDDATDILVYTSDRRWFTAGFTYDSRGIEDKSGWRLSGSVQYIDYDSRTIKPGESRNLGGLSLPNVDLSTGVVSPVPNFESFKFGGSILAGGLQLSFFF